jgi:hypothetical protein
MFSTAWKSREGPNWLGDVAFHAGLKANLVALRGMRRHCDDWHSRPAFFFSSLIAAVASNSSMTGIGTLARHRGDRARPHPALRGRYPPQ